MSSLLPWATPYIDRAISPIRGGMKPPFLYAYRHRSIALVRRWGSGWNFSNRAMTRPDKADSARYWSA